MADGPTGGDGRMRSALSRLRPANIATRGELQRLRTEVSQLRAAVTELEDEVQECRRLNRRLAEITDVVQELLLPAAQRDDARLQERLDSYTSSL